MFPNSKAVQVLQRSMQGTVRRTLFIGLIVAMLLAVAAPMVVIAAPADAPTQSGYTYYVKKGDSLSKIAKRYGITVYALAKANGLYTNSYIYIGQHLHIPHYYGASGCRAHYYVKYGDTLSKIAKWYGVKTYALARANKIGNAHHIYTGQRLCIPSVYGYSHGHSHGHGHGHHTVKKGQTLAWIAKHYGVSTYKLAHHNGIHNIDHIYVGQVLKIPRYY